MTLDNILLNFCQCDGQNSQLINNKIRLRIALKPTTAVCLFFSFFFFSLMHQVLVQRIEAVRSKLSEILVAFPNWKQTILFSEWEEEHETRKKVQHLEQESKTCQKPLQMSAFALLAFWNNSFSLHLQHLYSWRDGPVIVERMLLASCLSPILNFLITILEFLLSLVFFFSWWTFRAFRGGPWITLF